MPTTHEYYDAAGALRLARSAFDHARELEAAGDALHADAYFARAESLVAAADAMGDCEITAIPIEDCSVTDATPDADGFTMAIGARAGVLVEVKHNPETRATFWRRADSNDAWTVA